MNKVNLSEDSVITILAVTALLVLMGGLLAFLFYANANGAECVNHLSDNHYSAADIKLLCN